MINPRRETAGAAVRITRKRHVAIAPKLRKGALDGTTGLARATYLLASCLLAAGISMLAPAPA